jgi:drug/metabolite transporter (DMT)-like permease
MLVALAAVWGASFLFIRLCVDELGAVGVADGRLLLAAATLALLLVPARRLARPRAPWRKYFLLGAVNAAAPFTLIALAETRLDASLAAIINASTPLFSALVGAAVGDERITARRGAGLVLGMAGVAVVVGLAHQSVDTAFVLAAGCSVLAALCYAIGTTYAKHALAGEPPNTMAFGQQIAAGTLMLPVLALFPPPHPGHGGALAALAALAVLSTALAYLVYFRLVAEVGPTNTLAVTFLVPVFGVLWAALFLGERLTLGTLAGGLLILASVSLVTGAGWPAPRSSQTDEARRPSRAA